MKVKLGELYFPVTFIPSMALSCDVPDCMMTQFFTPKIGSCCGTDSWGSLFHPCRWCGC